jgi:hypothetical protein
MSIDSDAKIAQEVSARIAPMLHGLGPHVQSAVLADLFSMWLAGHQGPDAVAYREVAIANWLQTVRELVPVNEQAMLARMAEGTTKQ